MKRLSTIATPLCSAIVLGLSLSLVGLGLVRHGSIQMTQIQRSVCGQSAVPNASREVRIRIHDKWFIWASCDGPSH